MRIVPPAAPAVNSDAPPPDPPFVPTLAGPQAANQIASTFDEQLASVFAPRPKPSRRDAGAAELAELRRQMRFVIRRVYGERRGGSAV